MLVLHCIALVTVLLIRNVAQCCVIFAKMPCISGSAGYVDVWMANCWGHNRQTYARARIIKYNFAANRMQMSLLEVTFLSWPKYWEGNLCPCYYAKFSLKKLAVCLCLFIVSVTSTNISKTSFWTAVTVSGKIIYLIAH